MAPRIRSNRLETRTQRAKLPKQRKPHAVRIAPGIRLGYRRNEGAGTWSVICADGAGGSWLKRVALADDHEDANGKTVMDYWQAVDAARKLARAADGPSDSQRPATVTEAIEAYRADLEANDGNPDNATRLLLHLTPGLAARPVSMLTAKEIRAFRDGLMKTGISRATVNRYMKSMIACLNLAARTDERITNARAWKLPALPDANAANNVVITEAQVLASIHAAYEKAHACGLYVETLAVLGARPIQARRMLVSDLQDRPDRTWRIMVPSSRKGGRRRRIERKPAPLPAGLAGRLRTAAAGRASNEPLLLDPDGQPWKPQHGRMWKRVAKAAKLPSDATIYSLRHTSIVRALLKGIPTRLVASAHDTSTLMLERHYAKYIQTDPTAALMLASQVNYDPAAAEPDNVVPMVR